MKNSRTEKGCTKGSPLCRRSAYLSDEEIKDLTAYIQTLGRNKNWRVDANGNPLNDYEK